MPYLLKQPFTNGATGESWRAGRTLTDLSWLTDEQKQGCIGEGSLELIGDAPTRPNPDDLTLLDGINADRASMLNEREILTFADVVTSDITFLPRVGPATADAIKRQAKELADATKE